MSDLDLSANNSSKRNIFNFRLSVAEAILASLIVLICSQVIAGIFMAPSLFVPSLTGILLPLGYFFGYGSAIAVIILWKGLDFKKLLSHYSANERLISFLFGTIFILVVAFFSQILTAQIPTEGVWILEQWYNFLESSFQIMFKYKWAAIFTVSILAPIFEEWLFRGLILRGMLQKGISPWVAIFISALAFGVVHMNPWQSLNATILGVALGVIYYRTGSLWLVVFLHFVNNSIASYEFLQSESMEIAIPDIPWWYFLAGALGSVITYFVFKFFTKKIPQWN